MINLTITGNIGADAILKQLDNNTVCNFAVACKTMRGREAVVTWVDCAMWGKRAEALANYLTKGSAVTVLGNLANIETYTNKQGEAVAKIKVTVIDVALQGGKQDGAQPQEAPQTAPTETDDLPF
jgi:single-strand DNA-binding protein